VDDFEWSFADTSALQPIELKREWTERVLPPKAIADAILWTVAPEPMPCMRGTVGFPATSAVQGLDWWFTMTFHDVAGGTRPAVAGSQGEPARVEVIHIACEKKLPIIKKSLHAFFVAEPQRHVETRGVVPRRLWLAGLAETRQDGMREALAGPLAGPQWAERIQALTRIASSHRRGAAICAEGIEVLRAEALGDRITIGQIAERAHVDRKVVPNDLRDLFGEYPALFPTLGDVRGEELEEMFGQRDDWRSGIAELKAAFCPDGPETSTFRVGRELLASAVGRDFVEDDERIAGWLHVSTRTVRRDRGVVSGGDFRWLPMVRQRGRGRPPKGGAD
jgi:hypothetical protein